MKKLLAIFLLFSVSACADYKLTSPDDCGPCALLEAETNAGYHFTLAEIKKTFNWKEGVAVDLLDTPSAHFQALKDMGIPYRIVTCQEVLNGSCQNGKTVLLLHSLDHPILTQHWVVLRNVSDEWISVQWGDGSDRLFNPKAFATVFAGGGPTNTAYEVGQAGRKPKYIWEVVGSWFAKVMKFVFGRK